MNSSRGSERWRPRDTDAVARVGFVEKKKGWGFGQGLREKMKAGEKSQPGNLTTGKGGIRAS